MQEREAAVGVGERAERSFRAELAKQQADSMVEEVNVGARVSSLVERALAISIEEIGAYYNVQTNETG